MTPIAVLCMVLVGWRLVVGYSNCRSHHCVSGKPTVVDPYEEIDNIYNELPCAMQGGLCVIKTDCLPEKVSEVSGLCPAQINKNIECCYGISIKDKRCRKNGGQCVGAVSECKQVIEKEKIDDCAPGEICCALN